MKLGIIVLLVALIVGVTSVQVFSDKGCPGSIQGNPEGDIAITYFTSPFCTVCWDQDPILEEMLDHYGSRVKLETYDIRHCREEALKASARGTPHFVLEHEEERLVARGLQSTNSFERAFSQLGIRS